MDQAKDRKDGKFISANEINTDRTQEVYASRRKNVFKLINMAKQKNIGENFLDVQLQVDHNPSMVFDEHGRLKRWQMSDKGMKRRKMEENK